MKGRQWLMKWLPSRAYDNAVYVVFANPIGMDDDLLKNGCSMIIDPFGDVVAECRKMGNDVVSTVLFPEKLTLAEDIATPRHDGPNCIETLLGRITNQNKK